MFAMQRKGWQRTKLKTISFKFRSFLRYFPLFYDSFFLYQQNIFLTFVSYAFFVSCILHNRFKLDIRETADKIFYLFDYFFSFFGGGRGLFWVFLVKCIMLCWLTKSEDRKTNKQPENNFIFDIFKKALH